MQKSKSFHSGSIKTNPYIILLNSLILRSEFIVVPHHVNSSAECMTTMNSGLNLWVLNSGVVEMRPEPPLGRVAARVSCYTEDFAGLRLRDFKIVYYTYICNLYSDCIANWFITVLK